MICEPYLPPCLKVVRQVTSTVQFAAISETARPRRGLRSHDHVLGLLSKQRGGGCLHPSAPASQQRWFRASCKERRPQSTGRERMSAQRTHDVHLRHNAQIIGDLLRHGLQLIASVQRELHADNLSLLPEPIVSCPNLAARPQVPRNHWTQQLPEVPPTNSDDTIPIAPRPPSSLTTELEPAARPQVPRNHWTQQLLAQCHQSLWRHHPDCSPAAKQLDDRVWARSQSPRTSQSQNTATACTVPPITLTTPTQIYPGRQAAWRPSQSPQPDPRTTQSLNTATVCTVPPITLTTPTRLYSGRQAAWRSSMSPQPEPEYHAITEHSNSLHNATKHFDDTIPIVPRPPSSLTTETELAARPKDLAITEHSNCLHSATNHFWRHQPKYTPAAKQLDERVWARNQSPNTTQSLNTATACTVPPITLTTPSRLYPGHLRHTNARSLTLHFATRITRYGKSPWFQDGFAHPIKVWGTTIPQQIGLPNRKSFDPGQEPSTTPINPG